MQDIQAQLMGQMTKISSIPSVVLSNWPAMVSFAVVDYVSEAIIRMLPRVGGYAGFIEGNVVNGARDVIKMATWDAVRH
jgi:hypothetical protein